MAIAPWAGSAIASRVGGYPEMFAGLAAIGCVATDTANTPRLLDPGPPDVRQSRCHQTLSADSTAKSAGAGGPVAGRTRGRSVRQMGSVSSKRPRGAFVGLSCISTHPLVPGGASGAVPHDRWPDGTDPSQARKYGMLRLRTIGRNSGRERVVILANYEHGPNSC